MRTNTTQVVINFKTAPEATGRAAVSVAQSLAEAAMRLGSVELILAVQPCDIYRVASKVQLPIYAQHIDAHCSSASTGHISAQAICESGAVGTLLNHAERRLGAALRPSVEAAHQAGLATLVCVQSADEAALASGLDARYIGFEPPMDKSGDALRGALSVLSQLAPMLPTPILFGGGLSASSHLERARSAGAQGVLLSSAVVKAKAPGVALLELFQCPRTPIQRRVGHGPTSQATALLEVQERG